MTALHLVLMACGRLQVMAASHGIGFESFVERHADFAVVPPEHKSKLILKSGICNPSVAVNGRVAGIWNIVKNEPVVEFFEKQPKRIVSETMARVDAIRWRVQ